MRHNAKVLYVMDGNFSEFETLKQVLDLAGEYQLDLTLFDIVQKIARPDRLLITSMPISDLKERALRNRLGQLDALVSMINHRSCKLRAHTSFGIDIGSGRSAEAVDLLDQRIFLLRRLVQLLLGRVAVLPRLGALGEQV